MTGALAPFSYQVNIIDISVSF